MSMKSRISKSALVALALALPSSTLTAFADDGHHGGPKPPAPTAAFEAHYNQNAQVEAGLLNTLNQFNVTNADAVRLKGDITLLNNDTAALYNAHQSLLNLLQTNSTPPSPPRGKRGREVGLTGKILFQELQKELNSLLTGFAHQNAGHGDDSGWGRGRGDDHGKKGKAGKSSGMTAGQLFGQQNSQGNSNSQGNANSQSGASSNTQVQAILTQIQSIYNQLAGAHIHTPKFPGVRFDGDDERGPVMQNLSLKVLENSIIRLQNVSIADTRLLIAFDERLTGQSGNGSGSSSGSTTGPAVTVTVSPDKTQVTEGSTITYTVQLKDAAGNDVHQSGVQIDFAVVGSNVDGNLSALTAVTNANGQATVTATAGSVAGALEVSAQIAGSSVAPVDSAVTAVSPAQSAANHLVLSGTMPSTMTVGQTVGGSGMAVIPETSSNVGASSDVLAVTTSNPSVLALDKPDANNSATETLADGNYTLPVITAKAAGSATITVIDETAASHPSLTFNIQVRAVEPAKVLALNPNGSLDTQYYISTAGVVGPFTLEVFNASGQLVPATHDISLSAAQVNAIIGTGNGVRLSATSADVPTVTIPAGQSQLVVYVDGANAGYTTPSGTTLSTIAPIVQSASVTSSSTVAITYDSPLGTTNAPNVGDFQVNWGTGAATPQSVAVSGSTVTLTLWGAPLAKGQTIYVSYNPANDQNGVQSIWGANASTFANLAVANPLQ